MPESLPPDLIALRDRTEALAVEVLVPLRDEASLEPADRAKRVRAACVAAALHDEPAAGSVLALVVVTDTLGAHDVGHLDGVHKPEAGVLARVGEPLRSTHLAPLLAGDKRGGFAITEPSGMGRATWARVDGDEIVVNGAKSYVTGGGRADFLTALVDVEGSGPSMVVIDTGAPGVTLARRFATIDGAVHAGFEFKDVRVPVHNIIGRAGEGTGRAMEQITRTRLAIAAMCVGSIRFVVEHVGAYLMAPGRGGQPRGAGERIRLRYGDMAIRGFAARSMLYRTARLADAGENVINEAIAAKVFATEAVGVITDTAIQLIGGDALIVGHPLEVIARRVRSFRLAEGDSDTLRVNIARGHLDLGKGRI